MRITKKEKNKLLKILCIDREHDISSYVLYHEYTRKKQEWLKTVYEKIPKDSQNKLYIYNYEYRGRYKIRVGVFLFWEINKSDFYTIQTKLKQTYQSFRWYYIDGDLK